MSVGATTKDRLAIRNRFYEKGWHLLENVHAVLFRNITLWLTFFIYVILIGQLSMVRLVC